MEAYLAIKRIKLRCLKENKGTRYHCVKRTTHFNKDMFAQFPLCGSEAYKNIKLKGRLVRLGEGNGLW